MPHITKLNRLALYITTLITALTLIQANIIIKQITSLYDSYRPEVFIPPIKNQILGISIKIADAIKQVESGGNYNAKGLSGERGGYQFMIPTYNALSKKYFGEILPMTPENQRKVALAVIDDMVKKGYTKEQIALYWNSGQTKRCSSGINRWNVKFDSCAYVQKVVAHIK